ncbi:response regulator [Fimbriimonas ginsengisoli]|uniref:Response regulator receiver domain-containing protein n=1 Tax=Fimbriimonas ginsengisoli Gsoil 348 TaxID=661478 RepID=A0A068NXP8_FIMGI|nr:response regulator [Fimbriimonas ginsengisoli]AIE87530.1 response regulator receiver domain-containing protein [Fimbriimonas ginsengisoli Gsoil 348]
MSKLRVLLVEDNPDDERLARRALRSLEGVDLEVAHDGQEAIDRLGESSSEMPKLVLLDLKLPKVGGLDVLRWIRGHEKNVSMPVVVFSSSDEVSDRVACQRLHANSFIQKPVDFDRFLKIFRCTVEYWLTIHLPATRDGVDELVGC